MSLTPEEIELIKWLHEKKYNDVLIGKIVDRDKPEIREVKYEVADNSQGLFLLGVMILVAILAIVVMG